MALDVLNRPLGLASAFGLRADGRGPSVLSDQFVAVVESLKLLTINLQERIAAGYTPALGAVNVLTIPQNEVWVVHQLTASRSGGTALPAATAAKVAVGAGAVLNVFLSPLTSYESFVAGEVPQVGFTGTLLLPPGTILGVIYAGLTGAIGAHELNATISRLRA